MTWTRSGGRTVRDWSVADWDLARLAEARLLDNAAAHASVAWWRTLEAAGVGGRFLVVSDKERAVLMLPLSRTAGRGLEVPYTWRFEPIAAPGCDYRRAGATLAAAVPAVLVLEGTDPDWAGWPGLTAGMREAGRRVQRFASFPTRHERLEGRAWAEYLADRPSALRSTIRRRLARAEADAAVRFSLGRTEAEVVAGTSDYVEVAARSWKPREPLPNFLPSLAREAGRAGWLRTSAMRQDGTVVAAQIWSVEDGIAIVHKLAHDEVHGAMSPGTVLTAWTIRRLIETEAIQEIDFGRGDDTYKQGWAGLRRERVGLVVSDPRTVEGVVAIGRQAMGSAMRRIRTLRQ